MKETTKLCPAVVADKSQNIVNKKQNNITDSIIKIITSLEPADNSSVQNIS
jgi:hypothetical protein